MTIHASRRPCAPIRGLAVDAESGRPLAECALRFQRWFDLQDPTISLEDIGSAGGFRRQSHAHPGATAEWVVTDDDGRFVTGRSYPAGRVDFLTLDQERAHGQHRLDASGQALEVRLEVPVGPRVLLDFDPPGPLRHTDFIAGLWRDPEELVREDGLHEHPSPWSPDGGRRAGLWGNASPVRGSGPAWVRLSPESVRDMPLPSRIFLASRDGRFFGHALIRDFARYTHQALRIELDAGQALGGVLVWPPDEPEPDDAQLTLTALSADMESDHVFEASRWSIRMGPAELETPFLFQFVPPGEYTLDVEAGGGVPQSLDVQVPTEEPLRIRITPEETRAGIDLSVKVITASGLALDGQDGRAHLAGLFFFNLSDRTTVRSTSLVWSDGIGTMLLSDVRAGSYSFNARWVKGAFDIPLSRQIVELASGDADGILEVRIEDDVPTQSFSMRVIEPQVEGALNLLVTSAAQTLGHATFVFCQGGDLTRDITTLADGRRAAIWTTGPYPRDGMPEVSLRMEGYRGPTFGAEDFGPPDSRGVRLLEIIPQRGWSAEIHIYRIQEGHSPAPLEGLALLFDGHPTRLSDRNGYVFAEAPEAPTEIAVLTPGWELVARSSWSEWGSVIAAEGSFTVENGRLTVHVRAK